MDCLFCKMVAGQVPVEIVYQDKDIIAFDDIHPKAPHHKLIIPRKHLSTLNEMTAEDKDLMGHMLYTAKQLAKELGFAESGYRIVMNCNADGGQVIFHVHLHLLGGKFLKWPPG